jgi:SWI/SNF-related matrix-associated actin-dependent regulator of chromatin subfamily A protein 2/4
LWNVSSNLISYDTIFQAIDEAGEDFEEEEEEEEKKVRKKTRKRRRKGEEDEEEESTPLKKRGRNTTVTATTVTASVEPRLKRQMRKLMNIVIKYTDR